MVTPPSRSRRADKSIELQIAQRDASLMDQRERQLDKDRQYERLSDTTGLKDDSLIARLIELGFTPNKLAALSFAPIAEVSWASGYVTKSEERIASGSTFTPAMFVVQDAADLFTSWLKQRPSATLWRVWEDYTTTQLPKHDAARNMEFGRQLLDLATGVAMASGGFLDIDRICVTEQKVLNRIARVYGLHDAVKQID